MKANKFFLGLALIGAILTGCEKEPQTQTGEYDTQSYMSVSIAQAGGTRGTEAAEKFLQGTGTENTINSVDFYFYKADGAPFIFGTDAKDGANASFGTDSNLYTYNPTSTTPSDGNIDEIVAATLVISHNTGDIPAYMIAVINSTTKYANLPLSSVKTQSLANGKNSDGTHIMTNSVYKSLDGTEVIMATPIAIENLAINANLALANPVKIYVERTAARIEVKEATANTTVYNTGTKVPSGSDSIEVYARIKGWDIVTYANNTTLAKDITFDGWNTSNSINGFTWNRPDLYRSYWAKATPALTKTFSWNSLTNTVGSVDYCLENTTLPVIGWQKTDAGETVEDEDVSRTNVTKVVVAAQLEDASGAALQIVNWYGQNYTLANLKIAVAQSLKNDLILRTGSEGAYTYSSITSEQITVVPNKDSVQTSYEVYFKLVDGIQGTWVSIDEENKYVAVADANAVLKAVENAKIWNGKSYYIVNIEHLGVNKKDGDTYLPAYYGVVRNHAYEITFTGVKGLGTPVYDPTTIYPEPVTPENTESYVAAEINVLAWHLVKQTVTLQ